MSLIFLSWFIIIFKKLLLFLKIFKYGNIIFNN